MATSNNSTTEDSELLYESCTYFSYVVYSIIVGSICFLGIIGNLTSFRVFYLDKLKTSTTFLLQGLAIVDTLMLIVCIPVYSFSPFYVHLKLPGFRYYINTIHAYLISNLLPFCFITQTATIWMTILVAFNRYIAVCKPYRYNDFCNMRIVRCQMAMVIICSIIYNIPRFLETKVLWVSVTPKNSDHKEMHAVIFEQGILGNSIYYRIIYKIVCYFIFLLLTPFVILTIFNTRLIKALKITRQRRAEMQLTRREEHDNSITVSLIVIIFVFIICQVPALINQILWSALADDEWRQCGRFQFYFSRLSNTMVIFNSAANFFIYFSFNSRFRQFLLPDCDLTQNGADLTDNESEEEQQQQQCEDDYYNNENKQYNCHRPARRWDITRNINGTFL